MSTVTVGDVHRHTFDPITRTDIVRYQGASGDFHPLHHDEPFAQQSGFPSVFSVGMLQAGLLSTFVTDWLGVDGLRRFTVRFQEQVWPGDELSCVGTVTSIEDATFEVELVMEREPGRVALRGSAVFTR